MNRSGFAGGRIVAASAALVAAETLAVLVMQGANEQGFHVLLRATAITSLMLFLSAYIASSVRATWPGRAGQWLLDNRRYLGLSFAVSHGVHLVAIVGLWRATGIAPEAVTLVIGGMGYVFLAAMAATSSDAAVAWLGARRWKTLHAIGIQYLWLVFALTLAGRVARSPVAAVAELALLGALALKISVRMKRRSARQLRAA
jgi:hypothetical protein